MMSTVVLVRVVVTIRVDVIDRRSRGVGPTDATGMVVVNFQLFEDVSDYDFQKLATISVIELGHS